MGYWTGVLGGSFDPIHNGHLSVARAVKDACRLHRVLFVPSARPPHKRPEEMTPAHVRARMVEAALSGESGFELSRIEVDRPGTSYTVDTLRRLRGDNPQDALFLIIGADNAAEFGSWCAPEEVAALAQVIVVRRRGFGRESADARFRERMRFVETPYIDVSSTDIRERVRSGASIQGLVPPPLNHLIMELGLYRARPAGQEVYGKQGA